MSFIEIFYRVIGEAVIPGVTGVLSFIPNIAILIFLLTLLRELGIVHSNMAPLFMGFSCSVPAIIACNTIQDKRSRYLIMLMIPYISCIAKLPIYVMISSVFFPVFPLAAVGSIYLIGILLVLFSLCLSKSLSHMQKADSRHAIQDAGANSFMLRFKSLLKRVRRPSARVIFDAVAESCLGFVKKAFTIILTASIIVWILQNLDTSFHLTSDINNSLLSRIGELFAPIFAPIGFGDWRATAALLTGISSKESVVSTFSVLAGSAESNTLSILLKDIFTPASAFSFMVFCLLYMPCAATVAAIRNITKSIRITLMILIGQTVIAWCFSFLIFYSIKVII